MWNNQGGFQGYGEQSQGGGGYMSPGFGTPKAGQDKKSGYRAQNLLPVTVAEVFNASQSEDKFFSGEIEISQITMVGLVTSVKESPTRIDYEIDDMTGPPISVKQFVDNDESLPDGERAQPMRENTYVRVCGHVRSMGGQRTIAAFRMTPIMDMNELTYHTLEVVHSHLMLNKLSGGSGGGTSYGNSMQTNNEQSYGDNTGGGGVVSGLSSVQNQVHMLIRSNNTEQGANINDVCQQLRGVPEKAIRFV
ncbi:RFA2 [Mytilus coruscus]|uniref:RFA2 n=1 Tax=Mytilus coruscus TaxID=42192 RepID=A0A6J8DTI6_MYTCO|nr:RFA2 [Mytilus coruscus]